MKKVKTALIGGLGIFVIGAMICGYSFRNQISDAYTNAWAKHLIAEGKKKSPIEVMIDADFNPLIPKKAMSLYAEEVDKEIRRYTEKMEKLYKKRFGKELRIPKQSLMREYQMLKGGLK